LRFRPRAVLCLFSNPMTQLWEANWSAFQAREVRLVQLLALLEGREELFRDLRGLPIGAQFRHAPELPCHLEGALADMAADHLQIGLFPAHVLSRRIQGDDQRRLVPGEGQAHPLSHEIESPIIANHAA